MLNNKLFIVVSVLALSMLSGTASAQSDFYVFGTFGNTNSDISFDAENRVIGDSNSYSLGAGFTVNPHFSLEAAYNDFGGQHAETRCPPDFACVGLVVPLMTKADLSAISLSVNGSIPLTDRFDVFGRIGIAIWDVDYAGISSAFNTSGEDLLYGVGVRWAVNDNWKAFLEYRKVELSFETAGIGLSYQF